MATTVHNVVDKMILCLCFMVLDPGHMVVCLTTLYIPERRKRYGRDVVTLYGVLEKLQILLYTNHL